MRLRNYLVHHEGRGESKVPELARLPGPRKRFWAKRKGLVVAGAAVVVLLVRGDRAGVPVGRMRRSMRPEERILRVPIL